jgi:hypothetical protein
VLATRSRQFSPERNVNRRHFSLSDEIITLAGIDVKKVVLWVFICSRVIISPMYVLPNFNRFSLI